MSRRPPEAAPEARPPREGSEGAGWLAVERTPIGDDARWRALSAHLPDTVIELDLEGRVLASNRVPARISAAELLGKPVADIVPEALRAPIRAALDACIRSGESYTRRGAVETPGGRVWWLARFVPVVVEGRVARVLLIASDVTRLVEAEQALRVSEERLALALDAAEYGVWDWNLATGEVVYDDRWLAILGFEHGEMPSDPAAWRARVHPDDMGRIDAAVLAYVRGETPSLAIEYRVRRKGGEYLWTLMRGKIVARDADGRPRRVTGTLRDVSARKHAEAEREALIAQLQQALADVHTLSGLLPICCSCKSIRDDAGRWRPLEEYVEARSTAQFSHGLCQACSERLHAELDATPGPPFGQTPDE
jgi:PAS domain S-box-containing protein